MEPGGLIGFGKGFQMAAGPNDLESASISKTHPGSQTPLGPVKSPVTVVLFAKSKGVALFWLVRGGS